MRKRTIKYTADLIFWYILYFLPIVSYLLFCFSEPIASATSNSIIGFETYLTTAYTFLPNNIIYNSMAQIFGSNGVFPMGLDNGLLLYFTWFIGVVIMHLVVDFLLFIPRLSHKWLNTFTQGD